MKIRFLLLSLIAVIAVGCSTFFDITKTEGGRVDEVPPSLPEDSTSGLSEKNEELRTGTESEPAEVPPLVDSRDRGEYSDDDFGSDAPSPLGSLEVAGYASDGADLVLAEVDSISEIADTDLSVRVNQQVTTLKAGEIDDNADWDTYLLYRRESLDNFGDWVHDVDVTGRRIIRVTDAQGKPILGATVSIFSGETLINQTRTYADGRTLWLPNAHPNEQATGNTIITVEKDGVSSSINLSLVRLAGPNIDFSLDMQPSREAVKLDVMFLLDATGSMSDEIAQLQENILSISQQIDDMGDVDVRFGLVHYRDRDDAYITQVLEFTPDVTAFQRELNRVRADGGGDTPESLNAGLHDALHNVEWRGEDTIKLVFLVADAPPHLDYPDDSDYAVDMLYAAEQGIKIHPIASSGLDNIGEYIFRQIGQTTMGRFIFLTYEGGTSGTAGDERTDLEAGEQDYTVDFLDGLVVRLVEEEINAFKGLEQQ